MNLSSWLKRNLYNRVVNIWRVLRSNRTTVVYIPPDEISYNQDGLMACTNCDFIVNEKFKRAYDAGRATDSWQGGEIHWRVHVILWAAERGLNLGGDFVECGVNKGGYSRAIFEYFDLKLFGDRKFFLLDTYEGFSEKYLSENEKARGKDFGGYEDSYEIVKKTFSAFSNAVLIKGPVPETLEYVTSDKISYLSIDMNCVEPEIAAAEFFWDKLVSGAVLVIDDYGWSQHLEQKMAFDEFARKKAVSILSLPTGQGILIKP